MTRKLSGVRIARAADIAGFQGIAEGAGLFAPDELAGFSEMIAAGIAAPEPGAHWLVLGDPVAGAAYVGPEPMAADVWNLWFIAVAPDRRGQGMLAEVVDRGRAAGARLLLVETASGPDFAGARRFYGAAGFAQAGRIGDYYAPGVDKLIFRRGL